MNRTVNYLLTTLLCTITLFPLTAQNKDIDLPSRIDPPYWWVGMKNPNLELIIYDNEKPIKDYELKIPSDDITIIRVHKMPNPKYLFIELDISRVAEATEFKIFLTKGDDEMELTYELKTRNQVHNTLGTLSSKDAIYLLFPDRFANGDASNDDIDGMMETADRTNKDGRHGGDIKGISQKLDYIQDLGFTALWINPLLENNMPKYSYHGYAITDHYNIDPRFGSNDEYLVLVKEAQSKGIKMIKDVVYNHCGLNHYLYRDMPSNSFFNNKGAFKRTIYREAPIIDPYASKADLEGTVDGWFDKNMPDFNQRNDRVKNYLIQNSIWWIVTAGLDGFRIDTYFYSDLEFMAELGKRIYAEYPKFGMFGETWVKNVPTQAYFSQKNGFRNEVQTSLPGVTDFVLFEAIKKAYKEEMGWTGGIMDVYYALSQDFLYEDASRNVLFLDNHDLSRIFVEMDKDMDKFKSLLSFIMTMRGIPCLYYGTEICMEHPHGEDHGLIRADFSGGWESDETNKFDNEGRTEGENMVFDFVKTLTNYRKNSTALQTGKLMQFIPQNGVYVYFRYDNENTVMVVMNTHGKEARVELNRFSERLQGFSKGKNIMNNVEVNLEELLLKPYESVVIELQK